MKTPTEEFFERLWESDKDRLTWNAIKREMLEKEKDQIMRSFYEGMGCQGFDQNMGRAEIYYNETYKK